MRICKGIFLFYVYAYFACWLHHMTLLVAPYFQEFELFNLAFFSLLYQDSYINLIFFTLFFNFLLKPLCLISTLAKRMFCILNE